MLQSLHKLGASSEVSGHGQSFLPLQTRAESIQVDWSVQAKEPVGQSWKERDVDVVNNKMMFFIMEPQQASGVLVQVGVEINQPGADNKATAVNLFDI